MGGDAVESLRLVQKDQSEVMIHLIKQGLNSAADQLYRVGGGAALAEAKLSGTLKLSTTRASLLAKSLVNIL